MFKNRFAFTVVTALTLTLFGAWAIADTQLVTFKAGDTIKADEVNANFAALAAMIESANGATSFTHVMTKDNVICDPKKGYSDGDYSCGESGSISYLDHPGLKNNPDAAITVTFNQSKSTKGENASYGPIYRIAAGVDYDVAKGQWYILTSV